MNHSPEPWRFEHSRQTDDLTVGTIYSNENRQIVPSTIGNNIALRKADAQRIVACVNFCAGIPTKNLGDLPTLMEFAEFSNSQILAFALQIQNIAMAQKYQQNSLDSACL